MTVADFVLKLFKIGPREGGSDHGQLATVGMSESPFVAMVTIVDVFTVRTVVRLVRLKGHLGMENSHHVYLVRSV